ncbi:DUF3871 family protein [Maribacter arcticus]|uniref:DUF3871 family protein n=1 Tax=Maribacter arcticus TaxID=561365 RepID=UPI003003468B
MELKINHNTQQMVQNTIEIAQESHSGFIEANTEAVTLQHLKNDCVIPVFSKDNESTISHYQFIHKAHDVVKNLFPELDVEPPKIRVSHTIKGRVPSAVGKPAKELLDHEKTIYYERCAFLIELPSVKHIVNGNELNLSVGGVRSYNQENLYSKKSLEKFKVFIGFKNRICTNLCISSDGFSDEIRIGSVMDLGHEMKQLFSTYNTEKHLGMMEQMSSFVFSEKQFAHFIGKLRMYQHLDKTEQLKVFPLSLNDSQINNVVKDYFGCPNFGRSPDGSVSLWNLYNMFTEANKSSFIDKNLERNVNAYELVNNLGNSLQNDLPNWFLS